MKNYYLSISNDEYKKILETVQKSLRKKEKRFIITANAEIFMAANNNQDIDKILTSKDNIVIADGVSIIKTAKYFGINLNNKIAGIDLCKDLLEYSISKKLSIYIYGCHEEVLAKLKMKYPKANFIALKNGYDYDEIEIKKEILKLKPDLIFVALGVPRQELFINSLINEASKGVFIGVGGSIDVISGTKKRAPKFYRKHNLEWLYRIIKEPRRLKRFFNNNVKLLFVAKQASRKEEKKCK